MHKAKPVDIESVRELFKLNDAGDLIDNAGQPASWVTIGTSRYVVLLSGENVSYRRAVWACAHDSVPDRIFKIDRFDGEHLGNLSDTSPGRSKYPARIFVNGRTISLGYYPSQQKADQAVADYRQKGAIVSVRDDGNGWSVYERRGRTTRRILDTYPTKAIAEGVMRYYSHAHTNIPVVVVNGDNKPLRVGFAKDAYQAHVKALRWIEENPHKGFDTPFDYFEGKV